MLFSLCSSKIFNTFMMRMLAFFLIIIFIFLIFQIIAYNYYIKNIDEKVITNEKAYLKNISDRFADIISQIKDSMLLLYMEEEIQYYKSSYNRDSFNPNPMIKKIYSTAIQNSPFIKDLFIYKDNSDFIITAYSSHIKEMFFEYMYVNPEYNLKFCKALSADNFNQKYLPTSTFVTKDLNKDESSFLMPIVIKPTSNQFLLIALIDINNVLNKIDNALGENLFIYNKENLLYPNTNLLNYENMRFNKGNIAILGDTYYLKQLADNGEFVFIKEVGYESANKSLEKSRQLFLFTLLLSIIISFIISVLLTIRVNNPIKRIVEAISKNQPIHNLQTNISELNFINNSIHQLFNQNNGLNRELYKKDSLLKAYFYQTKFKNIYSAINEINDMSLNKGNFFSLIYFIIHYKEYTYNGNIEDTTRVTFFLTEFIQKQFESEFEESLTFQQENNEIITIINFNNINLNIYDIINKIAENVQNENKDMPLTIVLGSVYQDIYRLSDAHSEIYNISAQQRLNKNIQILTPKDLLSENNKFYFSFEQEQTLLNHFYNGNSRKCIECIHAIFENNYNQDVRLSNFQKLSIQILNMCANIYNTLNLDMPRTVVINSICNQINHCYTLEQFKNLLSSIITELSVPIINSKNSTDNIINFAIDYINKNYSEDICLDMLSEKLNITGSYLSQYFKTKTGINFSSYLNKVRIDKAKELLLNTNNKIENIAKITGYINPNSFIRAFKKSVGVTPKDFRNNSIITSTQKNHPTP